MDIKKEYERWLANATADADVGRDQHTNLGGMSAWMSRRGYSVKQAKADVVRA